MYRVIGKSDEQVRKEMQQCGLTLLRKALRKTWPLKGERAFQAKAQGEQKGRGGRHQAQGDRSLLF